MSSQKSHNVRQPVGSVEKGRNSGQQSNKSKGKWGKMGIAALLLYYILLFFPTILFAADVSVPEVKIVDGDIRVSTVITLDEKGVEELRNGISKEMTIYIDLFKVWTFWPDEFITGKKIINAMKSDPVKGEYIATSFDGSTLIKKRFRNFDSMLKWVLNIRDIKVANIRELEDSDYFIRVTAESRIRNLSPVIGYLLFFVPEKEFKITRDSLRFVVRNRQ